MISKLHFYLQMFLKHFREQQKYYNIHISINKYKEVIHVPVPFKKIMELIPSFVPLKRNQFQGSFLKNTGF